MSIRMASSTGPIWLLAYWTGYGLVMLSPVILGLIADALEQTSLE